MTTPPQAGKHVVVVGAGIVGVCCALYLLRDGHRVTVIDREGPGEGTSFGNGSVISVDSVTPVATPGIQWRVPGMLLDPLGPLRLRWGYLPRLTPWLLRFLAASRPARVEAISHALAALQSRTLPAYQTLLDMAEAGDMVRRQGWVGIYETESEFRADEAMLELQRQRGVRLEVLAPEELRQLEPALSRDLACGVFFPDAAHTVNNFRFVQVLAETFQRHGGTLLQESVRGFDVGEAGPRAVLTDTGRHACDAVVIAAGAWSLTLARQLGANPPLDTERGYHLQVGAPGVMPRLPVYSSKRAFVMTPLEHGLRIAGTVELGGLDAPPDWRRADALMTHAKRFLPGLEAGDVSRWMGFRPSMPDSLPVISATPRHRNAFLAFGHGHLGLTLAAATGEQMAALVSGRTPEIDLTPFRADRF